MYMVFPKEILNHGKMMSKDDKQEEIINDTVRFKGRGYWDICPGFGKTITAIKFINFVFSMRPHYRATIIVPSYELQDQWTGLLIENKVTNFEVRIINGIVQKQEEITTEICILDEVHWVWKGPQFSTIFQLVRSPYFIAMSGTISPDCAASLSHVLPLISKITRKEAERNLWVNTPTEYNLVVEMSPEEKIAYDNIHETCENCYAYFGNNFEASMDSTVLAGALQYVQKNGITTPGMSEIDLARYYSQKANVWRDALQKRIAMIHGSRSKLEAVAQIVNLLPRRKIITFGMLTEPADRLTTMIHGSKSLHGSIESLMVRRNTIGQHGITVKALGEYVLLPVKTLRKLYVSQFRRGEIWCMNTVKVADLGLDVPNVDTTIIYARDSVREKADQRQARGTRFNENVNSLSINVVLKDTKDEAWLKRCQKGKRIKVFTSAEDLVNDFKTNILHV
jgi:superfamily II DNA or RNA helicase